MGVVAQGAEHGSGCGEQAVLTCGRGKFTQARSEDEASLQIAGDKTVMLERDGESMRRRAGESGVRNKLREGRGACLESRKNDGGLVKDTDTARVVHVMILPSH
ncbi:hypothetical protein GCM10022376_13320 [Yimella lutea]